MPVIPGYGGLQQEDSEFKANLNLRRKERAGWGKRVRILVACSLFFLGSHAP